MFEDFFLKNYAEMKQFTSPSNSLLELGARDDRGVLSSRILEFSTMAILDRDINRINLSRKNIEENDKINFIVRDVFDKNITNIGKFDIVMTTALVHHTPREDMLRLFEIFKELSNKRIIVSGPNRRKQTTLYGDHRYHLDREDLKKMTESMRLTETAYLEHDDLAPPVGFFGEAAAKEMAIDGVNIIVYDKG